MDFVTGALVLGRIGPFEPIPHRSSGASWSHKPRVVSHCRGFGTPSPLKVLGAALDDSGRRLLRLVDRLFTHQFSTPVRKNDMLLSVIAFMRA